MTNGRDRELLSRLASGDQSAMKTIFQTYFSHIYHTTYRFVKNRQVGEDLAQEVFMKLWRKRAQIEIRQTIKGYLTTMAYHEAMGYLRKQKPIINVQELGSERVGEDGWEMVKGRELKKKIELVIEQLPPRCRGIFILSRFEGKTYREIAEIMDISTKTVENQMSKALQVLREALREYIHFWPFAHFLLDIWIGG